MYEYQSVWSLSESGTLAVTAFLGPASSPDRQPHAGGAGAPSLNGTVFSKQVSWQAPEEGWIDCVCVKILLDVE